MTDFDHASALARVMQIDARTNPNPVTAGKLHLWHKSHYGCTKGSEERDGIRIVCRTYENGTRNLWLQCSMCGTGRALRNSLWEDLTKLPSWDDVSLRLEAEGRAVYEAKVAADNAEIERKRQERRSFYLSYLRTPQWAGRREKVMRRANRVCEACGEARAEQVHHITYAHLGQEPLWELRAICRRCHEKIHGIDREEAIDL